jgi:UDP-N-acetylmuramoyl-tripeptide--D-alanyl-D-alanine ligase
MYLWQLIEYHIGRFLDHFRTNNGKKLIINPLFLVKIVLLILFYLFASRFLAWYSLLSIIYFFESALFLRQVLKKTYKSPIRTTKILFLTFASFVIGIVYFSLVLIFSPFQLFPFWFLFFDILAPVFISFPVLLFQPLSVFARNIILKKAKDKISKFKDLKVIAITGSYGKTTTKEFLTTILSQKYKVLSTKEHQNSEMGIAKCILNNLSQEHEVFVVEMGSYKKGGIKLLCDITNPKIGIVAGVNEQHLSLFGSLDNLLSAEGGEELAEALKPKGTLILNADNKYCLRLYKKIIGEENQLNLKIYSLSGEKINSDMWAESVSVSKDSISFLTVDNLGNNRKEIAVFRANVLGKQNIQNLLAAILAAKEMNMDLDEISQACLNIKQEQAGIILKPGPHQIDIIDSSYSANPDGVLADLDYLNIFLDSKKVIVMPCLIELGKASADIHEKIGQKIGRVCDMAVITTKECFKNIEKGAMYSGMEKKNIIFCPNPNDIYSLITLFCKKGDVILLEGRVPLKLINLLNNK